MGSFRNALILALIMLNLACDQISKTIVRREVEQDEVINLINKHLNLIKVENIGAFLSIGSSLPYFVRFILLILLPLILLVYGLFFILSRSNIPDRYVIGWCFVIGGGIGNLYDRIIHGSVTDFLHLDLIVFQTGVFNLADVSIITGLFIIFSGQLTHKLRRSSGSN